MTERHALLSASSAHRWLNCTPAPRLEEQFADTTSEYAAAGTLAHKIAEFKASNYFIETLPKRTYNKQLKVLQQDPLYDKAMEAATDTYLEHLKALAMGFESMSFVALETRVDYSHIAPEGFGTADCIMIGEGKICVVDYKNGSGVPVEAEWNPQMMLYALGAIKLYAPIFGDSIKMIHLSVVQPNAGGVKEWELSRNDLDEWGELTARPQAAKAYSGEGDFNSGSWCKFCRARHRCSARAAKMLAIEPMKGVLPPLVSSAEVGDILSRALELEAWIKDLQDYAFKTIMGGGEIPGFKVVEGRGSREWTDLDQAFATLTRRGVPEALLWQRKPVSVAGLEKDLGKKEFTETAADLVTKKPGKPTLVPETDQRSPYHAASLAFEKEN